MRIQGVVLTTALAVAAIIGTTQAAQAQISVGLNVTVAPPELPVYDPPPLPAPGWMWTPGYWAWADDGSGYYWVPGTWVEPPEAGLLWTPGYWGWESGAYAWHAGYWGPHVGFYGGVNYGYGYTGNGYYGAQWRGRELYYNTAVVHAGPSVHITNVYNKTVVNNVSVNRVSFNGGNGGIQAHPTADQQRFSQEHHVAPIAAQLQQREQAHNNPQLRASENHGHPTIAATARPGEFSGKGVIAARNAEAHPQNRPANQPDNRPENRANTHVAPENHAVNNAARPTPERPNVAEQHVPVRPAPAPEHHENAAVTHSAPAAEHHQNAAVQRPGSEHAAPQVHAPQPHEHAAAQRENVARAPDHARAPEQHAQPHEAQHPAPHADEHRPPENH